MHKELLTFHVTLTLYGLREYYDLIEKDMPSLIEKKYTEAYALAELFKKKGSEKQIVVEVGAPMDIEFYKRSVFFQGQYGTLIF
jgi:hypothetical protein